MSELAGQTDQFVNGVYQLMGLINREFFKMAHSESSMRHFETIKKSSI